MTSTFRSCPRAGRRRFIRCTGSSSGGHTPRLVPRARHAAARMTPTTGDGVPSALALLHMLTGCALFAVLGAHAYVSRSVRLILIPDADRKVLEKLGWFAVVVGLWLVVVGAVHVHTAVSTLFPQTAANPLFPGALSLMKLTCILSIAHAIGVMLLARPMAGLLRRVELSKAGSTQFLMQMNQSLLEQQQLDAEGKRRNRAQFPRPASRLACAHNRAERKVRLQHFEPLDSISARKLSRFEVRAAHRRWDMGPDARAVARRMTVYDGADWDFPESSDSESGGAPLFSVSTSRVANTLARQFHDAAATRIQLYVRPKVRQLVADKYRKAVAMASREKLPDDVCAGTAAYAI